MAAEGTGATVTSVQAGLLAWLLPGAGHLWLGHRGLAVVFFVAVSFPYWTGLALGGILDSVNPRTNKWVFLAVSGVGGYTVPCFFVSRHIEAGVLAAAALSVRPDPLGAPVDHDKYIAARAPYMSFYPESDVAQIYLATAGLLNVLAILDAVARAQTGGLPTFARELARAASPERGG